MITRIVRQVLIGMIPPLDINFTSVSPAFKPRRFQTISGPPDGFWIHLDADVFDETIMQSVDDPRPDGLTWDQGIAVLRTATASSQAAGLQIAIYNPDIDKDGSNGRGLAAAIRSALTG